MEKNSGLLLKGFPRIRIGVTGHRCLSDINGFRFRERVRWVFDRIRELSHLQSYKGVYFTVMSLLAEGADRVVASEVLKEDHSRLEVPLPLSEVEYIKDFQTQESRQEFSELLKKASRVFQLPEAPDRETSYRQAGLYILEHCDVLIAIWDGEPRDFDQVMPRKGGTADVVCEARKRQVPMFWIHADSKTDVWEERMDKIFRLQV